MRQAISNTSPLLYLHRIKGLDWLSQLFTEVWIPEAVVQELSEGARRGFDVPNVEDDAWMKIVNPNHMPSEWLALDLGAGELAAMALDDLMIAAIAVANDLTLVTHNTRNSVASTV